MLVPPVVPVTAVLAREERATAHEVGHRSLGTGYGPGGAPQLTRCYGTRRFGEKG
jgi:hypothetical protein